MRTKIATILLLLLAVGGVAFAADAAAQAVDPADGSLDLAKSIYNAFSGGHYAYAAAIGVILGVALVKRYLGDKITWLHSDAGGATLALVGATAAAVVAGAVNSTVTLSLLKSSVLVGIGAAGGFAVVKALIIEPLVKPLQAVLPAWAQPIFSIVLWIFDHGQGAGAAAVATAQAAGAAAVKAAPAAGASAVVGTPTEIK